MTVIKSHQEKASHRDIQDLERLLGSPLPDDYRAFLVKHNGGVPTPAVFAFLQDGVQYHGEVRLFFSATGTGPDSIRGILTIYKQRVPAGFLPIAADSCGNLVCLVLEGEQAGKVYFWDHEFECDEDEVADFRNVSLVANSFEAFLKHLDRL